MSYELLLGDCIAVMKTLPANSVQCVVTSPPYFGLRDYGTGTWEGGDPECAHTVPNQVEDKKAPGAITAAVRPGADAFVCRHCGATRKDLQLGLESTPEAYVERLVDVFREVRRVLRDDGTVWLNLGDSYATTPTGNMGTKSKLNGAYTSETYTKTIAEQYTKSVRPAIPEGIKAKDLYGIPWMVAFALRADGWYLRSDIVWSKPNPMPESVRDRPTKSHEYLFLLTKSKKYYYDYVAAQEDAAESSIARINQANFANQTGGPKDYRNGTNPNRSMRQAIENWAKNPGKRNRRSVWNVPTRSYKGAHFATFPPTLIEPCVLAGTSEHGCCADCGAPWQRVTKRPQPPEVAPSELDRYGNGETGVHRKVGGQYQKWLDANPSQTVGWQPTCTCNADIVPCTVLDPFNGAATTGLVALQHGRVYIGIDLNDDYLALSRDRLNQVQPVLLEVR